MGLSEYLNYQLNQFQSNLILAIENHSPEAIHDFRVALKKIFALYCILEQNITNFNKMEHPEYTRMKSVFKCAGVIRDNQVMMNISAQWLSPNIVKQIIDKMIESIHNGFKELELIYSELSIEDLKKKVMKTFDAIEKLERPKVIESLHNKIAGNETNIHNELQKETVNYHKIRKYVKVQYYLLTLLERVYADTSKSELKDRKEIAGKKLGEWHDLKVLMKFLTNNELFGKDVSLNKIEERARNLINEVK